MTNKLSGAWADGGVTVGAWVTNDSSDTVDVLARSGYDYVGIDCQHSLLTESDAGRLLKPLIDTPVAAIVRVSRNEPALIGRLLDAGADGVIVPLVDTAEEAAAAVAACRYAPRGVRSFGPFRTSLGLDTDELEARVNCFVMVESAQAIANLDAICATPGLDAVYIGPADLSFALGLAPRGDNPDPLHLATCDKIRETAHKHGIKCVMHCAGAAFAAGAVKRGFDMVMLTSDLSCMVAGARAQLDELKAKTA
jgi:4-hydroxy-2-oxoheptanedioate aldolase